MQSGNRIWKVNMNNKRKKKGDCFVVAGKMIYELKDSENVFLVHGVATGDGGDIKGLKHYHAWVELNGLVVDGSNSKTALVPIETYYRKGQIEVTKKYTPKEAMLKMLGEAKI